MVVEYRTFALLLERKCSVLSKIPESGFSTLQNKKILQSKSKMDRIKKDYFKKVVCELAKSKPSEVHLLSKRTISTQKQDYLTRLLRESSTNTFANMLAKKLRYSGAEIVRHTDSVDIEEHLCTSLAKVCMPISS